jgi:SAM-dependent methyltransferase
MRRFLRVVWTILTCRGIGYFGYLITNILIPKIAYAVVWRAPKQHARRLLTVGAACVGIVFVGAWSLVLTLRSILLGAAVLGVMGVVTWAALRQANMTSLRNRARTLTQSAQGGYTGEIFTRWSQLPVDPHTREAVAAARESQDGHELVIGRIDQDGRVLGLFGLLPGFDNIDQASFQQRTRYDLDIVLIGDHVLVRKDFRGSEVNFLHEWHNLALLSRRPEIRVPRIYKVDEAQQRLIINLIPGKTVRDILAQAGAPIRDVQTKGDPALAGLAPTARAEAIQARGRAMVQDCFSDDFLQALEQQLNLMHACKMARIDTKFGNVVVHPNTGMPWLVDFETARVYSSTANLAYLFRRDQDRERFNRTYGTTLITEASARAALAREKRREPVWYAAIDFGSGLTIGSFWSVSFGTGRWEFLNGPIVAPLIAGKRVLDLGSNNGIMPLMMLRGGATEVVGVELEPVNVGRADLVRRIYEWRDIHHYALQMHTGDMRDIVAMDWGRFDVVTAFCSLYYLPPGDMARVVRRARELAASVIVLQANSSKGQGPLKRERASVKFLKALLEENGFPHVTIYAPKAFTRPLLVGQANPSA